MEVAMKINTKLVGIGTALALAAHFGTVAMAAQVNGNAQAFVIEPLSSSKFRPWISAR